jgi:hypothetical protein
LVGFSAPLALDAGASSAEPHAPAPDENRASAGARSGPAWLLRRSIESAVSTPRGSSTESPPRCCFWTKASAAAGIQITPESDEKRAYCALGSCGRVNAHLATRTADHTFASARWIGAMGENAS